MQSGTLGWVLNHEARLAWRDWAGMMSAGQHARTRVVIAVGAAVVLFMHFFAWAVIGRYGEALENPSKSVLAVVAGTMLLSWSLMLSQALESVTRAFYARGDLDLILSSPVSARAVFAARIVAVAGSTALMAASLAGPFINVLAYSDGPAMLSGYAVIAAMGAAAAGLATAIAVALFRVLGAKRTRLAAQIVSAVVGATFVIGIQAAAIVSTGTISRFALLTSDETVAKLPDAASLWWVPARAALGDWQAVALLSAIAGLTLVWAIWQFAPRFGEHATEAAGVAVQRAVAQAPPRNFRNASPAQVLRRKELTLIARDPWLASQTLMQMLYLVPPALLLWRSFGEQAGATAVLVPVLVMAAGQLAGGLAWLAVSGEDAPDLIASAPVPDSSITRAKIEAVLAGMGLALCPLVLVMFFASPVDALVATAGILAAAASATLIQLWFRTQAKRSHFRRRQTSSRVATFAEAFSSISWAAAAGLAAAGSALAIAPGLTALAILAGVRLVRPEQN